jgi:hypothetical protein
VKGGNEMAQRGGSRGGVICRLLETKELGYAFGAAYFFVLIKWVGLGRVHGGKGGNYRLLALGELSIDA